MTRRAADVPALKDTVLSLIHLRESLPPGYVGVRSSIVHAEESARRALGTLLADLEMESVT